MQARAASGVRLSTPGATWGAPPLEPVAGIEPGYICGIHRLTPFRRGHMHRGPANVGGDSFRSEEPSTSRLSGAYDESSAGSVSSGDESLSGPRLRRPGQTSQLSPMRRPPANTPAYMAAVRKYTTRVRTPSQQMPQAAAGTCRVGADQPVVASTLAASHSIMTNPAAAEALVVAAPGQSSPTLPPPSMAELRAAPGGSANQRSSLSAAQLTAQPSLRNMRV